MKFAILIGAVIIPLLSAAQLNSTKKSETARRLWESTIQAKGGHDRLQRVTSLGILSENTWQKGFRSFHSYSRKVFDLPSKVWIRALDLPYQLDVPSILIMEALDIDTERGWTKVQGAPPQLLEPDKVQKLVKYQVCEMTQLYLLESSWYQPRIVALDESKWMGQNVFVLYVDGCWGPAAYVIDPASRLPIAFAKFPINQFGDELPQLPERSGYGVWLLDDYGAVDGIQLPSKTNLGNTKYELNKKYSLSLFTTAPAESDWGPWPAPDQKELKQFVK